jgi:hypothetical protein
MLAAEVNEQAIFRMLLFALAVGTPLSAQAENNSLDKIIQSIFLSNGQIFRSLSLLNRLILRCCFHLMTQWK